MFCCGSQQSGRLCPKILLCKTAAGRVHAFRMYNSMVCPEDMGGQHPYHSYIARRQRGMAGNTDGMGLLDLASCSLNTQPKSVSMEMTGWRRMLVVLFCFTLPGELAECMLTLFMSEELY